MRVVVVGTRGFPGVQGGVEKHCEQLYPRLVKLGCEVIVFTRPLYVDPAVRSYLGVELIPLWTPDNMFLEAFVHTAKAILAARRLKPDVLHIHGIGPSGLAWFARALGMKVVVTHHGPDYMRRKWNRFAKWFLRRQEAGAMKQAHAVISVSEPIAQELKSRFGLTAKVIPNGVQLPELVTGNGLLSSYGIEPQRYVLAVGRFVPEKGFHDLLDAWLTLVPSLGLRRDGSRWKLVIVGDADHPDAYSRELQSRCRGNGLVVLTGKLTGQSLQELYTRAGLFVLPSYYEGLPIVLLEALSYGLPCVISDIPANKCVKLPEERYFPVGDTAALAEKLRVFMERTFSQELRQEQRASVAAAYDWDTIAARTLEVYKAVKTS